MEETDITDMIEKYPFLSHILYGEQHYIGIVQNKDANVTSIYDYDIIRTVEEKAKYLELAEQWWWESNRMIPINIFLREDWDMFKIYVRNFNSKDVSILHGHCVSLSDLSQKRIKRKSITLVRKPQ